jgi:16S rRNA (uracil1498-N3)-methyltransferase
VVVKLDKHKETLLHSRYKRVALSASKQSQRNVLADIDSITDIKKVIFGSGGFDLKLIPTLPGKRKSLKEAIAYSKYKNILVLIGPEGDFSDEEIELAKKNGFIPVSLGDLVLRVETAAVSVASFIRLYYSDM